MKRFWIGVGLMLFFLVSGILLTLFFHRIHAPLSQTLERASEQALSGDWEYAKSLATDAREQWDKYRNITAAVADHEPMEEMEALFFQLEIYTKLERKGEFAAICIQLSQMASAMDESQMLTWWTLL